MRFPFSRYKVYGNSMLPTLKPDQEVLTFNWAYVFLKPKVGDLVVIRYKGREVVKRIHYISGCEYFVTGDNLKESTDSRNFGAINKSQLIGKVIYTEL